ncbi:MAG: aminopeptidase P N-terminal domain-containing protein [Bdellovibrionota bacterium]
MSRTPQFDVSIFKKRRERIGKYMQDSAMVIFSNPEFLRNHDAEYEYRQDTNFFYMTGFEEPKSVFVFRPGQKPETILFVRPKDELRETWDGFRYGPEGAKKYFGIDEVYLIDTLEEKLPELIKDVKQVYFRLQQHMKHDVIFLRALEKAKTVYSRGVRGNIPVLDSSELLGEFRLFKDATEIEWQRKACEITAKAHKETMKFTKPGMNERQIEGYIQFQFKNQLAARQGYNAIVASGKNATTLHYVFNDEECKKGDIILIDAGAEYNYFSGDITRSFPVSGKFSKIQKEFYEHVLKVNKHIISMVKPGMEFSAMQEKTIEMLTEAMIDLKLLKGKKEKLIKDLSYKKYYMHGVSHWLGMDVHDAGHYQIGKKSRKLEPGMVFTVEPGLYVPQNDEGAPKELRGLGVRIEDNILVTKKGYENLTLLAPKEVADIEKAMS